MDESDGVNFTEIAQLSPDLIIAVNSGVTQEEYERLTKIAPTVAYPTGPWVNSWQDMQRLTAKALGRTQAGEDLVAQTEELIRDRSAELGDAKGKRVSSTGTSRSPWASTAPRTAAPASSPSWA